jgi:hypothetical protein
MAGPNGRRRNPDFKSGLGQDETIDQVLREAEGGASGQQSQSGLAPAAQAVAAGGQFGLKLVPFVPVSFSTDAPMAWGRLIIYGAAAALTYEKARKLSYGFMAAAGVSLATSLGIGAVKS